ncbi:flap endonuclease GEN-like 1 isoform X2 [Silene latifolia]|uniref:flap endonuclease GEN-like 1 isoform X2 n=1 Tax=Silene latifolia TaxID=37657 RepID=UPI003D77D935
MGVGGNFWELLKPYAKYEGFDYLRNKKVAVDLSYWIVQHETALKSSNVKNPHLRLTFFRTINLFSKFGAFPVFIVDGKPSPLKSQARIARYFRLSGSDMKDLPLIEEGVSVDRNKFFVKCVEECVELLNLLGMPVLTALGEAEALCAQLNSEGLVDACITADSDAFLFGAKCVIKHLNPKSKEPIECYHMEDIELNLGLRRKHLVAVALLVGTDHNLSGVPGIGMETALRFVEKFSEDEVLQRLHEISSGSILPLDADFGSPRKCARISTESPQGPKTPHCSLCGHPGSKTTHRKVPCEYCQSSSGINCSKKSPGFKCECAACDWKREEKEHRKTENWCLKVCKKIKECSFSSNEIAELYLGNEVVEGIRPCLSWKKPDLEMLVDFSAYYLHWDPFYFYTIKWRKSMSVTSNVEDSVSSERYSVGSDIQFEEILMDESLNSLDELDVPQVHIDGGCHYVSSDENLELVQNAFPADVDRFLKQKEVKESKRKSRYSEGTVETPRTPNMRGDQMAITDYYRSSKTLKEAKSSEDFVTGSETYRLKGKSKVSSETLPKSVRRRLLFG